MGYTEKSLFDLLLRTQPNTSHSFIFEKKAIPLSA